MSRKRHSDDLLLPHDRDLLRSISSGEFSKRALQEALWKFRQPLLASLRTTHRPQTWLAKGFRVEAIGGSQRWIDLLGQTDSGKLLICKLTKGPITHNSLSRVETCARTLERIDALELSLQIAAEVSKPRRGRIPGHELIELLFDQYTPISDARTVAKAEIDGGDAHAKSNLCVVIGKSFDPGVKDSANDRGIVLFPTGRIERRALAMLQVDDELRRRPAQRPLSANRQGGNLR